MNVANVEVLPITMLPVPNLSDAVLAYANWKLADIKQKETTL